MPPKPISAYRKIVEQVLASEDWVFDGIDGTGHARLRYVPTGETTTYAIHAESDRNSVRNTAKDIERISGMKVWERSSRKPSRKRPFVSGFNPRKSEMEQAVSEQVEALYDELDEINEKLADTVSVTVLAWRLAFFLSACS